MHNSQRDGSHYVRATESLVKVGSSTFKSDYDTFRQFYLETLSNCQKEINSGGIYAGDAYVLMAKVYFLIAVNLKESGAYLSFLLDAFRAIRCWQAVQLPTRNWKEGESIARIVDWRISEDAALFTPKWEMAFDAVRANAEGDYYASKLLDPAKIDLDGSVLDLARAMSMW